MLPAVIVKASSGPRYVVGCRNKVDKAKLTSGTRVSLDMTTLTIMRALPREVCPSFHMMVPSYHATHHTHTAPCSWHEPWMCSCVYIDVNRCQPTSLILNEAEILFLWVSITVEIQRNEAALLLHA